MDVETAEQQFSNAAFETLDKAALVKILEKMDPKSILSLCQTNKHFAEICRDQTVFVRLMQVHYSNFPINQDAKAQYMAIAGDEYLEYAFAPDPNEELIQAYFPNKMPVAERHFTVRFSIRGTRIRTGTKVWVLLHHPSNICRNFPEVFDSKKDAIDRILELAKVGQDVEETNRIISELDKSRRVETAIRETYRPGLKYHFAIYQVQLP